MPPKKSSKQGKLKNNKFKNSLTGFSYLGSCILLPLIPPLFSFIIIQLVVLAISDPTPICSGQNYTFNSNYRVNLVTALSSISSDSYTNYFYNFSVGQSPDVVNVMAICRGDINPDVCRNCLNESTQIIRNLCPRKKEAVMWYDGYLDICMLRYSDHNIFHTVESGAENTFTISDQGANVTKVEEFTEALRKLLDDLRSQASRNTLRKFATGSVPAPEVIIIYGLVQCTPDLSSVQCDDCLIAAAREIPGCCAGKIGGIVVNPSCNLQYGIKRFFNETPPVEPPPLLPPPPVTVPQTLVARKFCFVE